MNPAVDTTAFQLGVAPDEDPATEGPLLAALQTQARAYYNSLSGFPPLTQCLLAFGVGGILGLFLMQFDQDLRWKTGHRDHELWVVVGDVPPAYFVTDGAFEPADALQVYCELMEDWADVVLADGDLRGVFPVRAAPNHEHARMLKSRVDFIREKLIPMAELLGG